MTDGTDGGQADDGFRAVLFDLLRACPAPTPADVDLWGARHPAHADALRECEEILAAGRSGAGREGGRRSALNALVEGRGMTLSEVADIIVFDRKALAAVADGRVRPPVGRRLVWALAGALSTTEAAVRDAIGQALERHASGEPPAAPGPRS